MIFATFDAQGFNARFYDNEVLRSDADGNRHPLIPASAIEITEADRAAIIASPQGSRWNGSAVVAYVPPVDLSAYASAAHVARRDGGVMVAGMLVKTDSESRGLISGAYTLSEVRPDATIDFKAANGWVVLTAATMQTIAIAVGTWVQLCYSTYRSVSDGIAAGSITTPAQIDATFAALSLPV